MSENNTIIINGKEWMLSITRNMSFWHQWISSEGINGHQKDFGVNAKLPSIFITKDSTETSWFINLQDYKKFGDAVIMAMSSDAKIKNLRKKCEILGKKLLLSLENLKKDISVKNFNNFIKNYRTYCAGLTITTVIGRQGGEILYGLLGSKGYEKQKIDEIISIITYPKKHTPLMDSQIDLLKIAKKIQNQKVDEIEKANLLRKWLKNYGHIPVNFCNEPWSISDAEGQLLDLLKNNCKEAVKNLLENSKQRIKLVKKELKNINNRKIEVLAKAIAEGTYLNEYRKNIFSKISLDYRDIFLKIANRVGSKNWKDCWYLTSEEMENVLKGKNIDLQKIIKERKITGSALTKGGKSIFLSESDCQRIVNFTDSLYGKNNTEREAQYQTKLKGFSANRGVARGIVKILLSSKDFNKLLTGEILVTTMTSVDFVPVMKRASAFITNGGGITSHASIISREMNKPCIIGTKIATKVLKDGDLVEVDAERGIVKIIKKAKP